MLLSFRTLDKWLFLSMFSAVFSAVLPMVIGATAIGVVAPAQATIYSASFENGRWIADSSELECRLTHPIPDFGDGVFSHRAGERLDFYLAPLRNPLAPGTASLVVEAPSWKPHLRSQPLAQVQVTDETIPLRVPAQYAHTMLASLQTGLMPTIAAPGQYASQAQPWVKVAVSSVNFAEAYQQYQQCLVSLLPVTFDQIARSAIFFNINKHSLGKQVKGQLDLIARFIKADERIRRVFIDGHTDDTGTLQINTPLSQRRADAVVNYFKSAGVDKKIIVRRYHADKYPALENTTSENRARNRRVTVRLVRD